MLRILRFQDNRLLELLVIAKVDVLYAVNIAGTMPLGNRKLSAPPRNTLATLAAEIHTRINDCLEEMAVVDERAITISAPESILIDLEIIARAFTENSSGYQFWVTQLEKCESGTYRYYFHIGTVRPKVAIQLDKPNDWVPEFIQVD